MGIALDESTSNKNVNTTLLDFFPGYSDRIHQNGKEAITLYHLLTMTAGLDWDEITYPHPHERNPNTQISRFELKPFSRQSFYGHWEAVGDVHIDFVESETGNVSEADIHCLLGTMKFRKTDGHDLWPIKKHITFQSNGQLGL